MMKKLILLPLLPICSSALAAINMQGASGLFNVPSASVIDYGTFSVSWDEQVNTPYDGYPNTINSSGNDFNFAVGLFPHVEVVGRSSTGKDTAGSSDLAFNMKLQLPYEFVEGLSFATGYLDLGGASAASNYNTKYVVSSYELGPLQATVGYGEVTGNRAIGTGRLGGAFGGLSLELTDWLRLIVEDDAYSMNKGFQLSLPEGWLPAEWDATFSWMKSSEEGVDNQTDWYGFALSLPLAHPFERELPKPVLGKSNKNFVSRQTAGVVTTEEYGGVYNSVADAESLDQLIQLRKILEQHQFERVKIQRRDGLWLVAFESERFTNNYIDAIGLAAGLVSEYLDDTHHFYLQFERIGVPVFGLEANAGEWQQFLQGKTAMPVSALEVLPKSKMLSSNQGQEFLELDRTPALLDIRPNITISPILATYVGTEWGVLDYTLAARADLVLPLWKGAAFNINRDWGVYDTKDYRSGERFGADAVQSGIKDRLFTQTVSVGKNLAAMFSYGQIYGNFNGGSLETSWVPGDGIHAFQLFASEFENKRDSKEKHRARIIRWEWYRPKWNSTFKVDIGTFFNNDDGFRLAYWQNIGDARVYIQLKQSEETEQAALGFVIPLNARSNIKRVANVQFKGSSFWGYGLSTVIGEKVNRLTTGENIFPTAVNNLKNTYLNDHRLSPSYVYANQERLRDVWLRYGGSGAFLE